MIKLSIEQLKKAREIGATHWDIDGEWFRRDGLRYLNSHWGVGIPKVRYECFPEIQPIDFSALDEQLKDAHEIRATHWDHVNKCIPNIQPIDFSKMDEQLKQENKVKLSIEQLKKAHEIDATHWDIENESFRKDGREYSLGRWEWGLAERYYHRHPEIQPIDFSALDDYQQDKEFDIAATGGEDDQMPESADMVNHPPHYQGAGVECIDAIRAALGPTGFIAYCRGNAIKYEFRADKKGDESENHKKAAWYIARAIAELESQQ